MSVNRNQVEYVRSLARRQFLKQVGVTGASVMLAGYIAPGGGIGIADANFIEDETKDTQTVNSVQPHKQQEDSMSVLFIARYNGNFWNFDDMRNEQVSLPAKPGNAPKKYPEATSAEKEAEKLFYPDEGKLGYGIAFEYANTFYQPRMPSAADVPTIPESPEIEAIRKSGRVYLRRGYGWIAIVKDQDIEKMLDALQYPHGPLCEMYDIEVIPLNNDHLAAQSASEPREKYEPIYKHMTPAHWNAS